MYTKSENSRQAGMAIPVSATQVMQPAPAQQVPSEASIISLPGEVNIYPIPPAMTQVIVSDAGSGALSKTVYFGNEATFNSTPTNNGSGASSISNTYGDGWSGKGYNQLFGSYPGVKCYGFTLQFITTSGGAQNPSGITTASPTLLFANMVGTNQIPYGIVLSAGSRNTQYLSGEMTVKQVFYMNPVAQLSYVVPAGNTATLTVLTAPF